MAPLPDLTYDPKDHALHTEKDVPHELLNRFNAGDYEEPEVKTRLIYMSFMPVTESEKQWPGVPSGCRHPTQAWRETISGLVNGGSGSSFGVPLVAFDRQLSFPGSNLIPQKRPSWSITQSATSMGCKHALTLQWRALLF